MKGIGGMLGEMALASCRRAVTAPLRGLCAAVLIGLSVGCGTSLSPAVDGSSDAAGARTDVVSALPDADGALDSGIPDDSPEDVGPLLPDPPLMTRGGFVEVVTGTDEWPHGVFAFATFFDLTATLSSCVQQHLGACVITDCRHRAMIDEMVSRQPTAGSILVTDSASPAPAMLDASAASGAYWIVSGALGSRRPDDPFQVGAVGGDVPAFAAQLPAPPPFALVATDAPDGGLVLDRMSDTQFTWTPVVATVRVLLVQSADLGGDLVGPEADMLLCYFDGRSGEGSVPMEALAGFSPEEASDSTVSLFAIQTVSRTVLSAGDFTVVIDVGAGGTMRWPPIR